MSFHYLVEGVEGCLEPVGLDGKPCVLSRLKNSKGIFCSGDSSMETYISSLSGMTYEPLTESHGGESLMSYQGGSLVKMSRPLHRQGQGWRVKGQVSGKRWVGLSMKLDQDTSSWKIHPSLPQEDLMSSCMIWPKWGTMQSGVCWERERWEVVTNEIGCGSWPTPLARDWKGAVGETGLIRKDGKSRLDNLPNVVTWRDGNRRSEGVLNPTFVEWLMGWPEGWTKEDKVIKPFESWQSFEMSELHPRDRTDKARLQTLGNGQVPQVMMQAWKMLFDQIGEDDG